ncbi:MAG: hypothetical protein HRU20_03745 [Pseudomonadales bacterium]|nr:hypothetical protein [Pseudomonadales bacterium]
MPLFKLKKTVLLSSAISAAIVLTACGGGGGGGPKAASDPCDSTFKGSSAIVVDSYDGGVLKGHIEGTDNNGEAKLKTVTLKVRGHSDIAATIDGAKGETCQNFTLENIPAADALAARDNDSVADYTLTATDNNDVPIAHSFLARGAELKNVSSVQLNNTIFSGPAGKKGLIDWLQAAISAYDIKDALKNPAPAADGAEIKPTIFGPASSLVVGDLITQSVVDSNINHAGHSLLVPGTETNTQISGLVTPVLSSAHLGLNDNFYIYITDISFGGESEDGLDNGAKIDMQLVAPKSGNTGFDIDVVVVFEGVDGTDTDTTVAVRVVSANKNSHVITGIMDIDFVVPSAAMQFSLNASNGVGNLDILSLLAGKSTPGFGVFQIVGSGNNQFGGGVVSEIKVTACTDSMCDRPVNEMANKLDNQFNNFVNIKELFAEAVDPSSPADYEANDSLAKTLRDMLVPINDALLPSTALVDLEKDKANPKQVSVTSLAGKVTTVNNATSDPVAGGFVGVGGSVIFDNPTGIELKQALGSYFEIGGSSEVTQANFSTDGGVVIAISEASINQTLLAMFESDVIADQTVIMTPQDLGMSFPGVAANDPIHVEVNLSSAPYMDVGSEGNQPNEIEAVMDGLSLKVTLIPLSDQSSFWNGGKGSHIMDIALSPRGTIAYEIVNGLPQIIVNDQGQVDVALNIHSLIIRDSLVQTAMDFEKTTTEDLKVDIEAALAKEVSKIAVEMGNQILSAQKLTVYDLKPTDGVLPEMFATALPKTVGVVVKGFRSDTAGKNLLLIADVEVADAVQDEGVTNAIYSFTFCDSNDVSFTCVATPQ